MKTVAYKLAFVALCTTALTAVSQTSQAAVAFSIDGGGFTTFDYSTAIGDNNVINATGVTQTGSTVVDPTANAGVTSTVWHASTNGTLAGTAVLNVSGLNTAVSSYTISWTFIGNEAAHSNGFTSGTIINALGDNRNNNNTSGFACCTGVNPTTTQFLGNVSYTTTGATSTPLFSLKDNTSGATVINNGLPGSNPVPNGGAANLIFAYLTPHLTGGGPAISPFAWDLTTAQTNTIVFGFNDDGSADDNHDDWMGIATVTQTGRQEVPIPGALSLFGSVLGGGLLFRRLRKRKAAQVA
jgi:hypothetical protein